MSQPVCVDPIRELLPFYLNGSLGESEAEAVFSHLAACPACARDLDGLSELAVTIETHGTAWTGAGASPETTERAPRSPLLLAAAVLVPVIALAGWFYYGHRESRQESGDSRGGASATGIVVLDLAGGLTRGGSTPPNFDLPAGVTRVRFVFFIPVSPGAVYTARIRNADGKVVMPERVLEPLDSLGRASVEAPVQSFDPGGAYELDASRDVPGRERTTYSFAFVVRRPTRDGSLHD